MAKAQLDFLPSSYRLVTVSLPGAICLPTGKDWKPMPTIGTGVREIRIQSEGAYRVIYVAKFEEAIYVLHAFEKEAQKTAKRDIELARSRFRELVRNGP